MLKRKRDDSCTVQSVAKREVAPDLTPSHSRTLKIGAQAVGALAIGAVSFGALAIGALAIGRLVIGRSRILRLEIDELIVDNLRVRRRYGTDEPVPPATPGTEV